jgi:hypothetical protein
LVSALESVSALALASASALVLASAMALAEKVLSPVAQACSWETVPKLTLPSSR